MINTRLLYHYTSQEGLLGIIESRCLWATHIKFLNDQMEFKLGLERYKHCLGQPEVLRLLEATLQFILDDNQAPPAQALVEFTSFFEELVEPLETLDLFCTSFTSRPPGSSEAGVDAGDELGQWRGYSGALGGFAIGFDEGELIQKVSTLANTDSAGHVFGRCIYGRTEQEIELVSKIERFLELEREESRTRIKFQETTYYKRKLALLEELVPIIPRMKSSSFQGEHEARIIRFQSQGRDVLFRKGKSCLVPYVEIPLTDELRPINRSQRKPIPSVKGVVVGPSSRMEDSKKAVSMLLEANGYKNIAIDTSAIPYRDW